MKIGNSNIKHNNKDVIVAKLKTYNTKSDIVPSKERAPLPYRSHYQIVKVYFVYLCGNQNGGTFMCSGALELS